MSVRPCLLFILFCSSLIGQGDQAADVLAGPATQRARPSEIRLFWDTSYSMHERNLPMEVTFLDTYFAYLGNVSVMLQTFGYQLDEPEFFTVENGNWDQLKSAIYAISYDGSVGPFVLDKLETGEFNLLVTDGYAFPFGPDRDWGGAVFVMNSTTGANHSYLEELAASRESNYIPLHYVKDPKEAVASLIYKKEQQSYNYSSGSDGKRRIKGNVTDFAEPLSDVLVSVRDADRQTRTNGDGSFAIEASTSEILEFSAPGRENTTATVNGSTKLLAVAMPMDVKVLDEVVLQQGAAQAGLEKPLHEDVPTNFGSLDAEKSGFAIKQIDGDRLSWSAQTITDALVGKFAGVRILGGSGHNARVMLRVGSRLFAAWDVDGIVYAPDNPPLHINVQNIRKITIMPGAWAAARYGRMAAGGIIMVRTISQDIHNNRLSGSGTMGKNLYKEDAMTWAGKSSALPVYLRQLESAGTAEGAYSQYLDLRPLYDHRADFFYDSFRWFSQAYPDSGHAHRILSNLRELFPEDATALRIEAFALEEQGLYDEAREVYRNIYQLQPGPQSLRDLANINIRSGDLKRGWRLYQLYLAQNDSLASYGTDRLLRTEMIDLLRHHEELLPVKKSGLDLDSDVNDLMITVQWNNPNARFELQFVGPQGLYYTWHNTSIGERSGNNADLSEAFEIADIAKGRWLVNVKYLGNQEKTSTYLKFSLKDRRKGTEWSQAVKLGTENVKLRFLEIQGSEVVSLIP